MKSKAPSKPPVGGSKSRAPQSDGAKDGTAIKRSRGAGMQKVYDALRHDIIEMTISPGEALDEVRLSQRFSMSRTPIREALVRLEAEGLIKALSNRNTVVTPIDFANVPTYFDALTLMYRVTTRLAAQRRTAADLVEIRAQQDAYARAADRADAFAMIGINRDFHLAIAKAGRNPYFIEFFRRLLDEGRRLLRLYYSSYDDHLPQRFVEEHNEIIEAIVARDTALAEKLGGEHARQVVRQLQNFLASGVGADIAIGGHDKPAPSPTGPSAPAMERRSRKRKAPDV
jgi:DNA-binding GntR family transcriptional regulator